MSPGFDARVTNGRAFAHSRGHDDLESKENKGNSMNSRRVLIALVIINLMCLAFQFAHGRPGPADTVAPVLRAQALEIVDDHGRVRAELKVFPAQPNFKMPDGTTGFPEAVQLRLITSKGGPNCKLGATEDGSGLSLVGEKGYVQVLSRSQEDPFVKIVGKDGRQQAILRKEKSR